MKSEIYRVLMVQRDRTISYSPIYKMSKVENRKSNFKKKNGKNIDLIAKITWKKMAGKVLADEKVVALLLVILKYKYVNSREYVVERKME